jgi:hypothetical protein
VLTAYGRKPAPKRPCDHARVIDFRPLLDRLAQSIESPAERLTAARIAAEEARLGYPLHPLLTAVYGQVADGGFGPDYQLFPLAEAVDTYTRERTTDAGTEWAWPEGVLPILTWGCGMYAAVDCRNPDGQVLLFEPNSGDPDQAWWVDSASLETWFEHYLAEDGWWNLVEAGDDPGELTPCDRTSDAA